MVLKGLYIHHNLHYPRQGDYLLEEAIHDADWRLHRARGLVVPTHGNCNTLILEVTVDFLERQECKRNRARKSR
jgi:hypothetical protein